MGANTNDKKTWRLINKLQNRKIKNSNISEIKKGELILKKSLDNAEAFNSHFTTIGEKLANDISESEVYPLTCLKPADSSFNFHKINSKEVCTLLNKIDKKKPPISTKFLRSFLN